MKTIYIQYVYVLCVYSNNISAKYIAIRKMI